MNKTVYFSLFALLYLLCIGCGQGPKQAAFPQDMPVYPGATLLNSVPIETGDIFNFNVTGGDAAMPIKFYAQQLIDRGWKIEHSGMEKNVRNIVALKDRRKCTVCSYWEDEKIQLIRLAIALETNP